MSAAVHLFEPQTPELTSIIRRVASWQRAVDAEPDRNQRAKIQANWRTAYFAAFRLTRPGDTGSDGNLDWHRDEWSLIVETYADTQPTEEER